jgi:hypothetical protein
MSDDPEDDLIPRKIAAGYLDVSPRTLDRWAGDLLPRYHKGGRVFFKKRHLDLLKRGKTLKPRQKSSRKGFGRLYYYVEFRKSGRAAACEPIATSLGDLALHTLEFTPWKGSD